MLIDRLTFMHGMWVEGQLCGPARTLKADHYFYGDFEPAGKLGEGKGRIIRNTTIVFPNKNMFTGIVYQTILVMMIGEFTL